MISINYKILLAISLIFVIIWLSVIIWILSGSDIHAHKSSENKLNKNLEAIESELKNLEAIKSELGTLQALRDEIKNLQDLFKNEFRLSRAVDNENFGIRDFYHYKCQKQIRIGGPEKFTRRAPDPLYRVDGAWFVCADTNLFDEDKNECTVLSFGINFDPSFDTEMATKYKCRVESFDPFIETEMIQKMRERDRSLRTAVSLRVQPHWSFHRIGIVGGDKDASNTTQIGAMRTLNQILDYTKLTNKVVDVFKMDIEGAEWNVIQKMDIDYVCKYFKQMVFATHHRGHPHQNAENLKTVRRLESCFLLFRRDTRFYAHAEYTDLGWLTEFQHDVKINVRSYGRDGAELAAYLFSIGELYFVNKNFLIQFE